MRTDGYYWLFQKDGPPVVAQFAEEHWTIIGSIFQLAEDDRDMARYEIGPAVAPPKRKLRAVAAAA